MLRLVSIILLFITLAFSPMSNADENFVKRSDVQTFIQKMVKKYKFDEKTLDNLFAEAKIYPQVIQQVTRPLEKQPWDIYQMLFVNEWRIQHGVDFWIKYADAFHRAESQFGIPPGIIIATIGIETKYGQKTGDYRVFDSLTNLAFNHTTRADFFRKELEQFLLLTRDEGLDPLKVMGSYAGAIGQPQFMPSSYRYYAVNFSQSGKTDLMNNEIDVIGSIANYYKKHGWHVNEPVAIQAVATGSRFDYLTPDEKNASFTIAELANYGILPKENVKAAQNLKVKVIVLENRYSKEYWLVFHNFGVIKRYNTNNQYAMAVYQLSNYITEVKNRLTNG